MIKVEDMLEVMGIKKEEKDLGLLPFVTCYYKYFYILCLVVIEIIRFQFNPLLLIYLCEFLCGLLIAAEFFFNFASLKLKEKKSLNGDEGINSILFSNSKIILLFFSGFVSFIVDIISIFMGEYSLKYGSCLRILVLLTTDECQFSFIKLKEVFSKIGELGFVNLMIIYILSVIGYYCLYRFNKTFGFYFEDVTNSYLFLLQTITFDAWGDIARAAMLINPLYAIYFAFMIIFMGFFLQNLLVGTIATTVQPATEIEFEKSRVLSRKMPKYYVNILKEYISTPQSSLKNKQIKIDDEQTQENIKNFQTLLEEFNKDQEQLVVNLEGKIYNLKTKNIISLKD